MYLGAALLWASVGRQQKKVEGCEEWAEARDSGHLGLLWVYGRGSVWVFVVCYGTAFFPR